MFQLAKVIETTACNMCDMLLHWQFTVHHYYKVAYNTNRWTELESSRSVRSSSVSFLSECLDPNHISSVLLALSWSLLDEHQFATTDMQSWSTRLARQTSWTGTSVYACLLSAYKWYLTQCQWNTVLISSVYEINLIGPSTEPWGTLQLTATGPDDTLFTR